MTLLINKKLGVRPAVKII